MRRKKTERRKLIEKLDKICRKYVLLRDKNICQKCGKHVDKSGAHCSHVIPRSAGNYLRWNPMNLKLLCFHDHINWWHKNPLEAAEWFKKKFPHRLAYLEKRRHKIIKYSIGDLEYLFESLKNDVKSGNLIG